MLSWNHSHIFPVSQIRIIVSVTTALQLYFPSTPLVRKTIISPSCHFYNNNSSIAHQLSFSYSLVWFIRKSALVQFYRYGKHTALLNSTWRVALCFDLFLPLKKVSAFWFLLILLKKNVQRMSTAKRRLSEAASTLGRTRGIQPPPSRPTFPVRGRRVSLTPWLSLQIISKTGEACKFCQSIPKVPTDYYQVSAISYLI